MTMPISTEVGELLNRTADTIAEKILTATGHSAEELAPTYRLACTTALAAIGGMLEHAADRGWTAAELYDAWDHHCHDTDPVER